MPLHYYSDDILYEGTQENLNCITLYATFYAGVQQGIDLNLTGNPPYFFPSNPNNGTLKQFLIDFIRIFEELVPLIENGTFV